ncbi:MAG TPA: hypothetical protein VM942_03665 [Acidimicrobiales bacterium]|nr:hypothetical protein [Acidimicrobiales bacterium]
MVGLLLLGACTTIRGLIETEEALTGAGYTDVEMGFDSAEGFNQIDINVRPPSSAEGDAEDAAERAAEVVWNTFPLRFDILRVDLLGPFEGFRTTYTYGEMAEIFGARDPALDEKELGDDVVRTGVGVAVVLLVGGLLFVGAVVLAIVLGVRASRRRKSVTPPPWPPVVNSGGNPTNW